MYHRLDVHDKSGIEEKVRLFMLKTLAIWTFLPLIISPRDTLVKHVLFLTDIILSWHLYLKISMSQIKNWKTKVLLYGMFAVITLVQGWQLYIEFVLHGHVGWMSRYYDLLPTIVASFN
jgi:hypothetical protein